MAIGDNGANGKQYLKSWQPLATDKGFSPQISPFRFDPMHTAKRNIRMGLVVRRMTEHFVEVTAINPFAATTAFYEMDSILRAGFVIGSLAHQLGFSG